MLDYDLSTRSLVFQVRTMLCHPPKVKQTLTYMTASSANSVILSYEIWHYPPSNGSKLEPNCFRRPGRGRREQQWRNQDSRQELTSCQSMLGASRSYCTAVTPSGVQCWEEMGPRRPRWRYYYGLSRYTERRQITSSWLARSVGVTQSLQLLIAMSIGVETHTHTPLPYHDTHHYTHT